MRRDEIEDRLDAMDEAFRYDTGRGCHRNRSLYHQGDVIDGQRALRISDEVAEVASRVSNRLPRQPDPTQAGVKAEAKLAEARALLVDAAQILSRLPSGCCPQCVRAETDEGQEELAAMGRDHAAQEAYDQYRHED